ncbi:MAG TPA: hypothetical protein VK919_01930 [Solirubrobacterales bacterium]|nr:hypothetical protein [Solirubrobacterales bacterium]
MDLFLAGCQGTGLALAAGVLAGAAGRRGPVGLSLLAAAVAGGAVLFALSLTAEDHPAWPGAVAGALFAALAYAVARAVAEGARGREGGAGMTAALIGLAALALAGVSLLLSPVGLVALFAITWLAVSRRRSAGRKYEGLRTLR